MLYLLRYFFIYCLLLGTQQAFAEQSACEVSRIVDGDTFKCTDGRTIRLACVDAPERRQQEASVARSTDELYRLLESTDAVTLTDVHPDLYQRIVARVYADGVDVAAELLRRGAVVVAPKYCNVAQYNSLQELAKSEKRGIWSMSDPVMPWIYRHNK